LIFVTGLTMLVAQPSTLINIAGVISIFAFVLFIPLLWRLNYRLVPRSFPDFARPKKLTVIGLLISWLFYLAIAVWFLKISFFK